MTSATTPAYEEYPQYCYHLSPTITKWCPLQASDITQLRWHPGFAGQDDTFFHLNHPIRWVRIVGLVVAIDSFYGRRVYTVDDSTGVCIECTVASPSAPQTQGEQTSEGNEENSAAMKLADQSAAKIPEPFPDIDVGMIVDVKGNLKLFRDQKQIKIQKMQHIRSTNQEVEFWNKIKAFKSEVLGKPWVLEKKNLRRLEKENKRDASSKEKDKQKQKLRVGSEPAQKDRPRSQSSHAYKGSDLKKPYKPSKLRSVTTADEGQFDALGL